MQPQTKPKATTWWQLKIPVPASAADDAGASLIEAGALGVLTLEGLPSTAILACYDGADASGIDLVDDAVAALASVGVQVAADAIEKSQQNDANWAERWKQYFKPMKFGRRLWIVPSWDNTFENPTGSLVLVLDPGTAFGTGQHATTALCLRAVELYFEGIPASVRRKTRVLDVGCGTGVLGLAAAKLGAGEVLGIDNDPLAVDATQMNATAVMRGEATPLGDVPGTFHLVIANILAPTLIAMAPMLLRRLAPQGQLLLSGILREQADEVISRYIKASDRMNAALRHTKTWTQGEWVVLQFLL
jgi:ribosomal protein L11 methyltransferase